MTTPSTFGADIMNKRILVTATLLAALMALVVNPAFAGTAYMI